MSIKVVEKNINHESQMNIREKYYFFMKLKSIIIFIWTILLMLITLGGCKSIDVKNKNDLLPYMVKPVALLPTKPPKNLESVWPDLMYKMEESLRKMSALGRIKGIKELNNQLNANPKLRSAFQTYMNTLTLTGISDKEIALRLEDKFESPHFLLLDFVSFPCTKECPSDEQWIIRIKLIEANTADIIYRARKAHQLEEDEQITESYQDLAENMILDVLAEFQAGFIVPWHRWRYEHMKKVSEINIRSKIGI